MAKRKAKKRASGHVSKLLPVTRTVRLLQSQGWVADVAERKIGLFSRDWIGCIDVVAIKPGPEVLLIQCTGWTNVKSRERKVLASPEAYACVEAGCRIEVWGFHKGKEDPKVIDLSDLSLYDPLPYGHPDRL
jgi:hypothetical protein